MADAEQEQGQGQGEPKGDAKTFTQDDLNAILARETAKIERRFKEQLAALEPKAKLAEELEQKAREAEEAKLSATQRQELERKREREGYETRIKELDTTARAEREKRHALLIKSAAAQRVASVASKLFNPHLSDVVTREVSQLLRVEDDGQGGERVVAVMGAEGDREPLETAWTKIEAERLAPFFKAEGGAGAAHGSGPARGGVSWSGFAPTDKIAAGLQGRRTG